MSTPDPYEAINRKPPRRAWLVVLGFVFAALAAWIGWLAAEAHRVSAREETTRQIAAMCFHAGGAWQLDGTCEGPAIAFTVVPFGPAPDEVVPMPGELDGGSEL